MKVDPLTTPYKHRLKLSKNLSMLHETVKLLDINRSGGRSLGRIPKGGDGKESIKVRLHQTKTLLFNEGTRVKKVRSVSSYIL